MSFMKFRQCGCDCRDSEEFTHTNTAPCCDVCPDWESPCLWIARFGCAIEHDGNPVACADVYLRQDCHFGNRQLDFDPTCTSITEIPGGNCKWVALGIGNDCFPEFNADCPGINARGSEGESPCSWDDIETPTGVSPVDQYLFSWVLTITEAGGVLEYDHPSFGLLTYTKSTAWDCANPNTLELVTGDDAVPELPKKVCVVPSDEPSRGVCADNVPCGYTDPQDRCVCCDPCCSVLPTQPLFLACGECSESADVNPTVGGGNGLDGVSSPSGQTYGACATQCGVEQCVNWYCSSGQWKIDVYNDGVFCWTADITHECCPLSLGTGSGPVCSPSGCDVCVGPDCETIECTDCPGTSMPATLYASDGTTTWTLAYDSGLGYWQDTTSRDGLGCTGQTAVAQCTGTGLYFALAPSGQSCYATIDTCDPFDADCTFFGCDAASYSLSITA